MYVTINKLKTREFSTKKAAEAYAATMNNINVTTVVELIGTPDEY